MKAKTLILDRLPLRDDYRAFLHPAKMHELKLKNGNIIQIKSPTGNSVVAPVFAVNGLCLFGYIQIGRALRMNLNCYLGQSVEVTPLPDCPIADCIVFAPISDTIQNVSGTFVEILFKSPIQFVGMPVRRNQIIPIYALNRVIEFKVVVCSPGDYVIIGQKDIIACRNSPIDRQDTPVYGVTCYDDVGGLNPKLNILRQAVEMPLLNMQVFKTFGVQPVHAVLITGPSGCGKSFIASALRNETPARFVYIKCIQLLTVKTEEAIASLLRYTEEAVSNTPSIAYFDDFDIIASPEIDENGESDSRLSNALMSAIKRMRRESKLVIIATTRNEKSISPELKSRFDRQIMLKIPNEPQRLSILRAITRRLNIKTQTTLEEIAMSTEGLTGSQLKTVCRKSILAPIADLVDNQKQDSYTLKIDQLKRIAVSKLSQEEQAEVKSFFENLDFDSPTNNQMPSLQDDFIGDNQQIAVYDQEYTGYNSHAKISRKKIGQIQYVELFDEDCKPVVQEDYDDYDYYSDYDDYDEPAPPQRGAPPNPFKQQQNQRNPNPFQQQQGMPHNDYDDYDDYDEEPMHNSRQMPVPVPAPPPPPPPEDDYTDSESYDDYDDQPPPQPSKSKQTPFAMTAAAQPFPKRKSGDDRHHQSSNQAFPQKKSANKNPFGLEAEQPESPIESKPRKDPFAAVDESSQSQDSKKKRSKKAVEDEEPKYEQETELIQVPPPEEQTQNKSGKKKKQAQPPPEEQAQNKSGKNKKPAQSPPPEETEKPKKSGFGFFGKKKKEDPPPEKAPTKNNKKDPFGTLQKEAEQEKKKEEIPPEKSSQKKKKNPFGTEPEEEPPKAKGNSKQAANSSGRAKKPMKRDDYSEEEEQPTAPPPRNSPFGQFAGQNQNGGSGRAKTPYEAEDNYSDDEASPPPRNSPFGQFAGQAPPPSKHHHNQRQPQAPPQQQKATPFGGNNPFAAQVAKPNGPKRKVPLAIESDSDDTRPKVKKNPFGGVNPFAQQAAPAPIATKGNSRRNQPADDYSSSEEEPVPKRAQAPPAQRSGSKRTAKKKPVDEYSYSEDEQQAPPPAKNAFGSFGKSNPVRAKKQQTPYEGSDDEQPSRSSGRKTNPFGGQVAPAKRKAKSPFEDDEDDVPQPQPQRGRSGQKQSNPFQQNVDGRRQAQPRKQADDYDSEYDEEPPKPQNVRGGHKMKAQQRQPAKQPSRKPVQNNEYSDSYYDD